MNELEYLDKSLLVEGTEFESVPSTDFKDSEIEEFEDNTIELHEMVGTTDEYVVDSTTSGKQSSVSWLFCVTALSFRAVLTVME